VALAVVVAAPLNVAALVNWNDIVTVIDAVRRSSARSEQRAAQPRRGEHRSEVRVGQYDL
jgi:hypothetical protein